MVAGSSPLPTLHVYLGPTSETSQVKPAPPSRVGPAPIRGREVYRMKAGALLSLIPAPDLRCLEEVEAPVGCAQLEDMWLLGVVGGGGG